MLDDALSELGPVQGLVLHSYHGWQYKMNVCQEKLSSIDLTQSIPRKGNCLDNAVMEVFLVLKI